MSLPVTPERVTPPTIDEVPRPVIQRRDLGPIVHTWGTLILEDLQPVQLTESQRRVEAGKGLSLDKIIREMLLVVRESTEAVIDRYPQAAGELTRWLTHDVNDLGSDLTYANNCARLLLEGMTSGIMTPVNTFAISRRKLGKWADPAAYAMALRRHDFRQCMILAGQAANGYWGTQSSGKFIQTPSYNEQAHLNLTALAEDRYELASATIEAMRESLHRANHPQSDWHTAARRSGGCPVRHQGFPEATIGDFARDYLTRHDMPIPPAEGPSLIEDVMTMQADLIDGLLHAQGVAK